MWHTPLGDRTLVGAECELVRQALVDMAELMLEEADELAEYWPCGVKLFDEPPWQQRLALLTRVSHALLKPSSPMAELSAVNEAAIAAIFATIGRNVVIELDLAREPNLPADYDIHFWRKRIVACQVRSKSENNFYVEVDCVDAEEWELLLDCLANQILWDEDWDMPELFLDVEPSLSRARRKRLGIERDYYTRPLLTCAIVNSRTWLRSCGSWLGHAASGSLTPHVNGLDMRSEGPTVAAEWSGN